MKKIYPLILLVLLFAVAACNTWVTDIPVTNDKILDEQLNTESNIDLMVNGILNRMTGTSEPMLAMDGLSDALYFDYRILNATYPQYAEIDVATNIPFDNNSVTAALNWLYLLRMNSDTLAWRCNNKITFTDQNKKKKGLYYGYLGGGYARYLLAAYQGKSKTVGGGTINAGPFMTSNQLYDQAIAKYKLAIEQAPDAWSARVANSLIGRAYLFKGEYANAVTYLNLGLVSGDKAFTTGASTTQYNYYISMAGSLRQQWGVDFRYAGYITAVPDEAKRIPLIAMTYKGYNYWQQGKYVVTNTTNVSPVLHIDWQETALMKAECTVRGFNAGDPVTLINSIRTSRGMTTLITTAPDLNGIYVERDKELFMRGLRMVDERRFGKLHINDMWQYLPIPLNEILKNPNQIL